MRISSRNEEWLAVISVAGELDAATVPDLREEVDRCLAAGDRWLLVDLSGLEYIDSTGLGLLIGAAKRLAEAGGELAVSCARANVLRVFEISGTAQLLHLHVEEGPARCFLADCRGARGAVADQEEGESDE